MFDRVLFIVVTCSLDQRRADIFQKVSDSLNKINSSYNIFANMIVFDNASKIDSTISELRKYPIVFQSSVNIGYWSAVNWCLENYRNSFESKFDYVYIIESDILHYNFGKLREAVAFMDENSDVGSVRTQKFSKVFRAFYSKESVLSTFTHDAIRLTSYPSGKKAWFKKAVGYNYIYLTNLHAKLVGLNRLTVMEEIFDALQRRSSVSEADYFQEYFRRYKLTGILNGGIFTEKLASRLQKGKVTMGSYTAVENKNVDIYQPTRLDKITTSGFNVSLL